MATAATVKRPLSSFIPFNKVAQTDDMVTPAAAADADIKTPEPAPESKKAGETDSASTENKVAKLEQTIKKIQTKLMSRKKKEAVTDAAPTESVTQAPAAVPAETAPVATAPVEADTTQSESAVEEPATTEVATPAAEADSTDSSSPDDAATKSKPSVVAKLTGKFKRSRPATPQISSVDVSQPAVEEGSSQEATTTSAQDATAKPAADSEPIPKRRKLDLDALLPGSRFKFKKDAEGDSSPAPEATSAPADSAVPVTPATAPADTTTETPADELKPKKAGFLDMLSKKAKSEPSTPTVAVDACCAPATTQAATTTTDVTDATAPEKKASLFDKLRKKADDVDKEAHELNKLIRANLFKPSPKVKLPLPAEPVAKASLLHRLRAKFMGKISSNLQPATDPTPAEQPSATECVAQPTATKPETAADGTLPIPASAPTTAKTPFFARLPKLPLKRSSSNPEAPAEKKVKEAAPEAVVEEPKADSAPVTSPSSDEALAAPTPKRTSSFRELLNSFPRRPSPAPPTEAAEPVATEAPVPTTEASPALTTEASPAPTTEAATADGATETLAATEPTEEAVQEIAPAEVPKRKSLLDLLPIHKKQTPTPAAWELKLQPEVRTSETDAQNKPDPSQSAPATAETTDGLTTDATSTDAPAETTEDKTKPNKRKGLTVAATKLTGALRKKKSTEGDVTVQEETAPATQTEAAATTTDSGAVPEDTTSAADETAASLEPTEATEPKTKDNVSKRNSIVLAAAKVGDVFRKKKEPSATVPDVAEQPDSEPAVVPTEATAEATTTTATEATAPATETPDTATASESPTEPTTVAAEDTKGRIAKRNSFALAASKVSDKVTGVLRKKKADDAVETLESAEENPTVVVTSPTPVPASAADTVAQALEKNAANPKASTDEDKQSEVKVTEIGQAV